jgi:hypothetical protein
VAVLEQQRAEGREVLESELRAWGELSESDRNRFRRAGESFAMSDHVMMDVLLAWRKQVGEKAFRRKLFEMSVSVMLEGAMPNWAEP